MTYEMYRYVFLGSLIASGMFFVLSVVLFFALRIPKVISDLSGKTARKAIESIRMQNEQSGDKTYQSSAVNLERGKLTEKISQSGRLMPRDATPFGTGVITEKISTQQLQLADETDVLAVPQEPATYIPEIGETAVLENEIGETAVLDSEIGETTILAPEQSAQVFAVEIEITFIHTNEVIV